MARVKYVSAADAVGDARTVFAKWEQEGRDPINLHRIVANSPNALRNFLRLGNSLLLYGQLAPRLRELAILRIAQMMGADYEWVHHVPIAQGAGVDQGEISHLDDWRYRPEFDDREKAVIRYTEAVTRDVEVPDEVFDGLRKHLSEPEIVELTLVCGYWGMVARLIVALKIDIEPDFQRFLSD